MSIAAYGAALSLDETPALPGEWGFRPGDGETCRTDPPAFVWRPQARGKVEGYEVQCARDGEFAEVSYGADAIQYNCHCPPRTLGAGKWFWRFRFVAKDGKPSAWSKTRAFTIREDAVAFPLPSRKELISRIPKQHPRLFVRPEQLPRLKELARRPLKGRFEAMVASCEKALKSPPPTDEPPKYPKGMKRGSDPWRKIWWGNRRYASRVLNTAATLAFTHLLGGKEEYGQLAKRLLLAAAEWEPKGSTGYRYNDEAGMPYAYYFSRTYTFVHHLLSPAEKGKCRQVMTVRGREMYRHLCPRHLWAPYSSHSNRAWHFLGEVGIAFMDEIPEAEEWAWFAANVFANVYPVWCDDDGGWHEGTAYWSSYIGRFTWWADVMRAAMGIDAYKKPYFSKIGYYPMYLQPPGTQGGGFGDLTAHRRSSHNVGVMSVFAVQAKNPYWQWYVDAHGGPRETGGYVGFVRGALPRIEAKPPLDLPTSRCFWGTGQAMLNSNILDAKDNVQVILKSSPFGTQSHGYESQNSFLLYAFGERLLIRTGRRDSHGSKHHKQWMWHTKSTNCITVNGQGQKPHSRAPSGKIVAFHTSDAFDFVAGETGSTYSPPLDRFVRRILFVKPHLVLIHDELAAPKPSTFEWRLHAPTEMAAKGQGSVQVVNRDAACHVSFLWPQGLELSQTNQFDTPPRPRVKLVEWHLTAKTPQPLKSACFVTAIRPHRRSAAPAPAPAPRLSKADGGYAVEAELPTGRALILLRSAGATELHFGEIRAQGEVAAILYGKDGTPAASLVVNGSDVGSALGLGAL